MADIPDSSDDPMQVYAVEETPCQLLKVTLKHGTIRGAGPAPEIRASLSISPSGEKEASKKRSTNPEWNESFKFYLDPDKKNVLDVSLTIADNFHKTSITVNDLISDDDSVETTLTFANGSEIHIQLDVPQYVPFDLRSTNSLNIKEEAFLIKRKEKVMETMKRMFGENGPNTLDEVPVVGVLGSGGGFRAMIGYNGVMTALKETGLMDMTCYMAGLSGSAWLLAHLYTHPNWPARNKEDLDILEKEFEQAMTNTTILGLLKRALNNEIHQEEKHGEKLEFIDHYAHALGNILLKERMDSTLSGQSAKVWDANVPLPLYSCISVKEKEKAKNWHDWMEFSPFEVGMAKYGLFMPADLFGEQFFIGRRRCDRSNYKEEPLYYLMGIWGSAFNVTLQEFMELGSPLETEKPPEFPKPPEESEEEELAVSEKDPEDPGEEMKMFQDDDYHEEELMACAIEEISVDDKFSLNKVEDFVRFSDTSVRESAKMAAPRRLMMSGVRKRTGTKPMAVRAKKRGPSSFGPKKKVRKSWWRSTWNTMKRGWNLMRVGWEIGRELAVGFIKFYILGKRASPRKIPNFLSRLYIKNKKPVEKPSFFSVETFRNIFENQSPDVSSLFLADAGLAYNLPFPLLLRRQRNVEVILSFDFSQLTPKKPIDFQELKYAEVWAKKHDIPFPKIDDKIHEKEGVKECYIFKDEDNFECPVVIHFILANITFKKTAADEEQSFRNFEIWNGDYSTFKLKYQKDEVHRLQSLMEYNTKLFRETIEKEIQERVMLRRLPPELRPKPQKKPKDLPVFTRYVLDPVRNYWAGNRSDKDKE